MLSENLHILIFVFCFPIEKYEIRGSSKLVRANM